MTNDPSLANGDSRDYWAGAREGRLLLQKCRSCQKFQFPPRHHCAACWEADLDQAESAGFGQIESFTIVRRAPTPEYRNKVPYVVAAVLLDEGPRMITNILGDEALAAKIGDRVKVAFEDDGQGTTLPQFKRV
jgi:uncharacterized OB-fold protein